MMEGDIKPQIEICDVPKIASELYGLHVTEVTELNSYDDRNYHILVSSVSNANFSTLSALGYILKVTNSSDTEDVSFFEGQNEILLLLEQKHFAAPVPLKNVTGNYYSLEKFPYKDGTRNHLVRLFEYMPGQILKSVPATVDLYYDVGVWCARLNEALKNFKHPGIENRSVIWNLKRAPEVNSYLQHVKDEETKQMVASIINNFITNVLPVMNDLEQGIIHGDFNEQNILVSSNDDKNWKITSVIDFGDVNLSCYLFDISAAICYVMLEARRNNLDIYKCGGHTLAGYQYVRRLSSIEHSLLKVTICTRLCQSLVLGLYTQSMQPENLYVGDTQANGWFVLQDLWTMEDTKLKEIWPPNAIQ